MTTSLESLVADLSRLTTGTVSDAEDTLATYARDYGGLVERPPLVVVQPTSPQEVAQVVGYCYSQDLALSGRGGGLSLCGQSLSEAGVVIDLRGLDVLEETDVAGRSIWAQAGVTWRQVVAETVPLGLVPPVLTSYLGTSVGGTLSSAGFGNASFRNGAQIDHCSGLEVAHSSGELVRCGPEENRELFEHVLGGYGQFGLITRARLDLRPIQPVLRTYYLQYDDLGAHLADEKRLMEEKRGSYVEAMAQSCNHGLYKRDGRVRQLNSFNYPLNLTVEASSAEDFDDEAILADLGFSRWIYACNFSATEYFGVVAADRPPSSNLVQVYVDVLMPWTGLETFIRKVETHIHPRLANIEHFRLGAVERSTLTRRMLRAPDEPWVMGVGLYTTVPRSFEEQNMTYAKGLIDLGRSNGGSYYLIGSVRLGEEALAQHFGEIWPEVQAAKRRHDPKGLLCTSGFLAGPG